MRIIVVEGFDALTIQRLAREVDASVGGLYRYYESKEAVLTALHHRAVLALADFQANELMLARGFVDEKKEVKKEVATLLFALVGATSYLRHASASPERHRLLDVTLASATPVLADDDAKEVEERVKSVVGNVVAELERAVAASALEPGDNLQRTYAIWAVVHGMHQFKKRDRFLPETLHTTALLPLTLGAILRGWGAPTKDVERAIALFLEFDAVETERHSRAISRPPPAPHGAETKRGQG